jgi:N-acetylmuramoyl-L-alanine amidase
MSRFLSFKPQVIEHASPNFTERRGIDHPDMVVLHYTGMKSAEAALERLCDPVPDVSAHYLIAEDGRVWRLVAEEMRAWHAGASRWGAIEDVNSHSIGVEIANPGHHLGYPPFPEPQMAALEWLLTGVLERWRIPPERVVGHEHVAPGRKIDPGEKFDWARLARKGLAVWPIVDPSAPEA